LSVKKLDRNSPLDCQEGLIQ